MTTDRDTIFALSSGRPPAAIAVIRISGPHAGIALRALTGRLPQPRHATLVRVRDPAGGEIIDEDVIDEGLALWFPGPGSETDAQRRQAFQHLKGLLGERAETWRRRLIEALALVEAGIDFSDEDDVPREAMAQAL